MATQHNTRRGCKPMDLSGHRFGRWQALRLINRGKKYTEWLCRCDCGNERIVQTMNLRAGISQSCGCLLADKNIARRTHGHSPRGHISATYRCWRHAKSRCFDPNTPDFPRYGGRGITMCDRWRNSFEAFLEDMGEKPKGMSIDRFPNRNGNYEPGNCRWATPTEQARNQDRFVPITWRGETLLMCEWAERLNIPPLVLSKRKLRRWTLDRMFTQQPKRGRPLKHQK